MGLSGKQKKYIRKHLRKEPIGRVASELGITVQEITEYLGEKWTPDKYQKFFNAFKTDIKKRVGAFNFLIWLKKNKSILAFLTLLVCLAYANSLGNSFVSDDRAIMNSQEIYQPSYFLSQPLVFVRPLFYFVIAKIFNKIPAFYRLLNIFFHLGSVLTIYLLLNLIADFKTALFAAAILAVHPLQSEAITWISGGPYSQYAFFLLLALLAYIVSFAKNKFFWVAVVSFFLALFSSEKAVVFPFILLGFTISFRDIRKDWKKLLPFFIVGGFWILLYIAKIPQRMNILQTEHYVKPRIINPIYQVPVAISSYLELIFWPKGLTLYHTEMTFSLGRYLVKLIFFLIFLGITTYSFFRHRLAFFWLSFFIISLLPTLTPFGISWIVAERYVYLGAIGVFVVLAMVMRKLTKIKKLQPFPWGIFAFVVVAFLLRTVTRNVDWKNEDNLWIAASKTSPSSHQNHNNLGDVYIRHGNPEKAAEEFKKAIELKPDYADAYHNLANAFNQMGKVDLALENYKKAAGFNPNIWQTHQNLAAIYFNKQQFQLALEELEKAIKINPQNPDFYTSLALVFVRLDKKQEAKAVLEKALQIDPQNQKANQILSSF